MPEYSLRELRSVSRNPKLMCQILRYVEDHGGPIQIEKLEIDAPEVEVHRQLQILEEEGYLGEGLDKDTMGVPFIVYSNPAVRRGIEELCGGTGQWIKDRLRKGTEKGIEKTISILIYTAIGFVVGYVVHWLLGWP